MQIEFDHGQRLGRIDGQINGPQQILAPRPRRKSGMRNKFSTVLRRAVAEYLKRRRRAEIAEAYKRAYGKTAGLGEEFESWEHQGQWPPE